jgi:prephenate dehydrogenase
MSPDRGLLVVGTGLIGTSIAMAAGLAGYDVMVDDVDPARLDLAISLLARGGRPWQQEPVSVAVVATPPNVVGSVCQQLLRTGLCSTVTHISSVQLQPQLEVESTLSLPAEFVGSHPIAGRELSGPQHASPDLFRERSWVICPTGRSAAASVEAVVGLATDCGAVTRVMSAEDHDALLARLSHVPQLLASALAASLVGMDRASVALAGSGLRDTSRLADSNPDMWLQIVAANAAAVAPALRPVVDRLASVLGELTQQPPAATGPAVADLLAAGRAGRDLLTGKHGERPVPWATVAVIVPDEPGALARLLGDAASAGINVEDIRVEHAPGHPVGVVELAVQPAGREPLHRELGRRGWTTTSSPPRTG